MTTIFNKKAILPDGREVPMMCDWLTIFQWKPGNFDWIRESPVPVEPQLNSLYIPVCGSPDFVSLQDMKPLALVQKTAKQRLAEARWDGRADTLCTLDVDADAFQLVRQTWQQLEAFFLAGVRQVIQ